MRGKEMNFANDLGSLGSGSSLVELPNEDLVGSHTDLRL